MVVWLERGANYLHMVQLMTLPPTMFCFSKIQNGLPFWCWLSQAVLEKSRETDVVVVIVVVVVVRRHRRRLRPHHV